MNITIKYFGLVADITNVQEDLFTTEEDNFNTNDLTEFLLEKYPELNKVTFVIALNKEIITFKNILKNNDTIAILPPFAGG